MTRKAIADALTTVTGVSGHVTQPPAPTAGQGWPEWVRTGYVNVPSCGAAPDLQEWEVVLVLPALDPASGDLLRDDVAAALSTVGAVLEARPDSLSLQSDSAPVPVIRYALTIPGG